MALMEVIDLGVRSADQVTIDHVKELIKYSKETKILAHDIEYIPYKDDGSGTQYCDSDFKIHGCSFATLKEGKVYCIYVTNFEWIQLIIDEIFTNQENEIWAHFARVEHQCLLASGFKLPDNYNIRCTAVALNLLDEDRLYGLKVIAPEFADMELGSFEEASVNGLDSPEFYIYAIEDSIATVIMAKKFREEIKKNNLQLAFDCICPTNIIFGEMELHGIYWDVETAYDLQEKFELMKASLEIEIYSKIGRLNLNSGDQVRNRFFNELKFSTKGLELTKKGQVSVAQKNIEKLAQKYPVAELVMSYGICDHKINNYLNKLTMQAVFNDDGMIHGRFGLLQKTGRTNCVDPPLQTIPSHDIADPIKFNKKVKAYLSDIKVKSGFKPRPGKALIDRDYSSLEYRTAAVAAPDKKLIEMYRYWKCESCGTEGSNPEVIEKCTKCGEKVYQGKDLHAFNRDVANSFGLDKTRQDAKELSFLSIFCGGAWKLGNSWGISTTLAQKIIDGVFNRLQGLKKWHERTKKIIDAANQKDGHGRAMSQGEVRDMFGRRRKISKQEARKKVYAKAKEEKWDQKTLERKLRGAEKNLLNMLVNFVAQSPACILGQLAMQEFRKRMIEKGWWMTRCCIVNFVHDEILVECDEEIAVEVNEILKDCMENKCSIGVPCPTCGGIVYSETWPIESERGSWADLK